MLVHHRSHHDPPDRRLPVVTRQYPKEYIGRVPVMVLSKFCHLYEKTGRQLTDLGECIYDQGGYFVINGSEKVYTGRTPGVGRSGPLSSLSSSSSSSS
jgi:DNA-directed RNA polymerase beta subunit